MSVSEADRRDDSRLVVGIFVDGAAGGGQSPDRRTRLLQVIRDRTGDVELVLPEQTAVVSLGWVPEITYESDADGYSLNAIIRPRLPAFEHDRAPAPAVTPTTPPVRQINATPAAPSAADARTEQDHVLSALYEVTFRNREIAVNGFRLSRPNFNSENELVFEHLFRNPNRRVELSELEQALGRPLVKRLVDIVRNLGFTDGLQDIFFRGISKTTIEFVNPVTAGDFTARGLTLPDLGAWKRKSV